MNWGKILGDAAKTALVFGAVGALLALAAPSLGALVGETIVSGTGLANVGFQAAFFAGFGALSTVLTPVIKAAFGDKPEPAPAQKKHVTVNLVVAAPAQERCNEVTVNQQTVNNHQHTINNDVDIKQDVNVLAIDGSSQTQQNVANVTNVAVAAVGTPPANFTANEEKRRAARESILLGASQSIH